MRRWLALVLLAGLPALGAAPRSLDECDARVLADPDQLDGYRCYWFVARNTAGWQDAERRLESRLALEPENHNARLVLGAIGADLGEARAESLLREAAAGFLRDRHAEGEVHARVTLAVFLRLRGRHADALAELERALARAEEDGDEALQSEARIQLGWQAYHERDYGRAWSLLKRAEAALSASGPLYLRLEIVDGLAAVAWALGRTAEALDTYQREIGLLGSSDPYRAASVRRNIAVVALELADAGEMSAAEVTRIADETLAAALRNGNRRAEAGARNVLARLRGAPGAQVEAERALAIAREINNTSDLCTALSAVAEAKLDADPARNAGAALDLLDELLGIARARADAEAYARGMLTRAALRWRTGPRGQAVAEGLAALDAIEDIRDRQPDRATRVAVFGRFADAYRELAARLAPPPPASAAREDLELAFTVSERMRARALLDAFDAAGATPALAPAGAPAGRRAETLSRISGLQRSLMQGGLDEVERAALLSQLEVAESEERALRDEIARSDARFASLRRPGLAGLAELQAALAEDQALLSFLVPANPRSRDGAGRVLVVTRASARVVELGGAGEIDPAVSMYLALLERRDGSELRGAVRLHDALLREALAGLPPGVTRLLLVPDGPLHRLPFDSLRDGPGSPPLAVRYETSIVPSATMWLRWKKTVPAAPPTPLLALADPELPAGAPEAAERAAGMFAVGPRLGRLPFARREAARLRRALGGESWVGGAATEAALRAADLRRYAIVHFAAHAVLDDERPERSAVLLGADTRDQDGLLQVREIVDLPLAGQVIVLSACRGAGGPIVGGDGPAGLANAFFQAGARTVVAGLWSLRDDETAALVEDFGRRLAAGASVGAALAGARRELVARGAPPAAWAGLVVLGDADLVPLPGGAAPSRWLLPASVLALALLLLVAFFATRRWLR